MFLIFIDIHNASQIISYSKRIVNYLHEINVYLNSNISYSFFAIVKTESSCCQILNLKLCNLLYYPTLMLIVLYLSQYSLLFKSYPPHCKVVKPLTQRVTEYERIKRRKKTLQRKSNQKGSR